MKNSRLVYTAIFALMAIAQWFVPAQMIQEQEAILAKGKVYKFKTAPVDPYDAFRGKYIYLNFDNSRISVANPKKYNNNDDVYLILKDSAGYALIEAISKSEPKSGDYVKAIVSYVDTYNNNHFISIEYPFNRFYMNEYKAQSAEKVYIESHRNLNNKTYALVAIKDGKAVVKDVMINNVSIKIWSEKGLK
jgi:uncharacterized membrane-anchored protein